MGRPEPKSLYHACIVVHCVCVPRPRCPRGATCAVRAQGCACTGRRAHAAGCIRVPGVAAWRAWLVCKAGQGTCGPGAGRRAAARQRRPHTARRTAHPLSATASSSRGPRVAPASTGVGAASVATVPGPTGCRRAAHGAGQWRRPMSGLAGAGHTCRRPRLVHRAAPRRTRGMRASDAAGGCGAGRRRCWSGRVEKECSGDAVMR